MKPVGPTVGKPASPAHPGPVTDETPDSQKAAAAADPKATTKPKKPAATVPADTFVQKAAAASAAAPVFSVRATIEATAQAAAGDALPSSFPLDDLSKIKTNGRWAAGFRLDGGLVRLMWVSARRLKDKEGKQKYEIFFFAHGKAVELYKGRLEAKGAKSGSFKFKSLELDEAAESDKATMVEQSKTWGPSSANGLKLTEDGKYEVDFLAKSPEAIKGAVRITVHGDDAQATKNLNEVIKTLGMQSVFAPPTPRSLERFKMMRFLWQVAPEALDQLGFKSFDDLEKSALNEALVKASCGPDSAQMKAISAATLSDETLARRLNLAELLYEHAPKAFINWAYNTSQLSNGLLNGSSNSTTADNQLDTALQKAGVSKDSDAYKAAENSGPDPVAAAKMLRLGLLVKQRKSDAETLLACDIDDVKPAQLAAAVKAAGYDPTSERFANMRFEEVYPGYFTVVDPKLAEELEAEGARYLYSTADHPERVWQMLTGGQKSSFTRFQEGILVQGKSSDSDFGSGGAFSIFSRLVTKGAIDNARKGGGGSNTFHNWSGSRPYKLIINRRALGRLDWYGYNSDNYGRTTSLTPANKGAAIIKTIAGSYGRTNEIMFAVGNDPAYVDFVVCESQQQKDKLLEFLEGKGIESFNGKSIDELVRIESKFFLHPMDMTVAQAVEDAVEKLDFKDVKAEVEKICKAKGAAPAKAAVIGAAKAKASELADDAAQALAKSAASSHARKAADGLKANVGKSIDVSDLTAAMQTAAEAAAKEGATKAAKNAATSLYMYSIENAVRSAIQKDTKTAASAAAGNLGETARDAVLANLTPNMSLKQLQRAVYDAVEKAVAEPAKAAALAKALEVGKPTAVAEVTKAAVSRAKSNGQWEAENAAKNAAIAVGKGDDGAAAVEAFRAAVVEAASEGATAAAVKAVEEKLTSKLSSSVRSAAKEGAQAAATEASKAAGIEAATKMSLELIKKTATAAVETFAESHAEPIDAEAKKAMVAEAVAKATEMVTKTASETVDKVTKSVADEAVKKGPDEQTDPITATLGDVAKAVAAAAASAVTADAVKGEADNASSRFLEDHARSIAKKITGDVIEAAATEAATAAAPEIAEKMLSKVAESVAKSAANDLARQLAKQLSQAIKTVPEPKPAPEPTAEAKPDAEPAPKPD